ncbi:MAG TPA: hypothetical protein VM163_00720 [bacterium]|nr:hypothetical protein [bacterium]
MSVAEVLGAIDIGTGSVLCLAVEKRVNGLGQELLNESIITGLGAGTASDPAMRRESIERTLAAVVEYVDKLREVGAASISIVGTSALRKAPNRDEFAAAVRQSTGLEVEVISGNEEARLTFWGATCGITCGIPLSTSRIAVMDVGGGSTELVLGSASSKEASEPTPPELAVSIPLGALTLTDRFITLYPLDLAVTAQLRAAIRDELKGTETEKLVEKATSGPVNPLLVAVGGSATTLVAMEHNIVPYAPERVQGVRVTQDVILKHIDRLGKMSLAQRHQIPSLPKGRAPVIDAGLLILHELLSLFGASAMTVSDRGLRYGVIVRDSLRHS